MAKKKTAEKAKIKAAPVLRDGGGNDPVITKSYIMRDDWIDKGVVNTVAFKSVDGEVQDVLVNGEPAGGGGGGDFSVAEVTITDTNGEGYSIYAPFVLESNEYIQNGGILPEEVTPASSIYPCYFTDSFNGPVRVALYKNSAYIKIDGDIATVTGNASIVDAPNNQVVLVTGNCTITVS
jgi:hypothetical protein